jgi:hypothetical protein
MNQVNFISKALITLYDNDWETCTSSIDDITWKDGHSTTDIEKSQIQIEVARLQAEYDSKEYQRLRSIEYPPLTDLADAMYWASQGDNTKLDAYYAACEAVKLKYPKANNE